MSRDNNRAKALLSKYKTLTKSQTDAEIANISLQFAADDISATLYELETGWFKCDLAPVNAKTFKISSSVLKTFEIPPHKTLMIEHQDRTKWLYFDASWWLVQTSTELEEIFNSLDKQTIIKGYSSYVETTSYINERAEELIPYESDDVSLLMQQEAIEINLSNDKLAVTQGIDMIADFDNAWLAGPGTDTIVFWSSKSGKIGIIADDMAQIIFIWQGKVDSPRQIKPVVQDALQASKKWDAFEIV